MSNKVIRNNSGFFLVELVIAIAILIVVLVGYLQLFVYCLGLGETSGGITLAITEAQDKIEEIRNDDFERIAIDYGSGGTPGNTFSLTQLNGTGYIYIISSVNPDIITAEVVISWQDKNRTMGGTDIDGDGNLDSPIELITMIAKR
jgi:Tfp pilus assembly protein PilV